MNRLNYAKKQLTRLTAIKNSQERYNGIADESLLCEIESLKEHIEKLKNRKGEE